MSSVSKKKLLDALKPVLNSLGNRNSDLNRQNDAGNVARDDAVYEAYIYGLVVHVLDNMGCQPKAVPANSMFVFRRGPGELPSRPAECSFVEFVFGGVVYELHLDVFYNTRFPSGGKAEVDVSILSKVDADNVRNGVKQRPEFSSLKLQLEAKHLGKKASTTPAKTYVATCYLLDAKPPESLVLSGEMTDPAKLLVTGPGFTVTEQVSPLIIHRHLVDAFKNTLASELNRVL